ncbi:MAG: sulfotransferase family protein [Burkholderiaceae bacterium]|nr:sulfotransferase family protein [Burkholderiaceae bacterium]
MPDKTLFFLHIPKCAGTSLLSLLERDIPLTRTYKNTSIFENFRYGREEIYNLSETAIKELILVWGHHLHEQMLKIYFPSNAVLLSTILREPVERFLSHINYDFQTSIKRGVNFDVEKVISESPNPMCNFLIERFPTLAGSGSTLAQKAINILEEFDSVQTLNNIDRSIELFQKFLDIKVDLNIDRKNESDVNFENIKIINIEKIKENLKEDIFLYEFFERKESSKIEDVILSNEEKSIKRVSKITENIGDLRAFLIQKVKLEYVAWAVLEKAIEQKLSLISSIADEVRILNALT